MPEAQRLNEGLDDLVVVLVCACRLRAVLGQEQALPADVLPLYPVKVLVSDMVFLLLKLNCERSKGDRRDGRRLLYDCRLDLCHTLASSCASDSADQR